MLKRKKQKPEYAVVTSKVKDMRSGAVPFSTVTKCGTCKEDVYLAPESQAYIKQHPKAAILCLECCMMTLPNKASA